MLFVTFGIMVKLNEHYFCLFPFGVDDRAIILDHGNPSMKNQIKQMVAAEGKVFLVMFVFAPQPAFFFHTHLGLFKISSLAYFLECFIFARNFLFIVLHPDSLMHVLQR